MNHSSDPTEHRSSTRTSTARPAIWSSEGSPETRIGWMLETSETGCAFAWRGKNVPVNGEVISVSIGESADPTEMSRALVKRVRSVHDDLAIVAVRFLPADAPLPPIGRAEAKPGRSVARSSLLGGAPLAGVARSAAPPSAGARSDRLD